ncbi:hypothetical protein V7161_12525, partial [Neobacillus drentensis]|uniref:hypothetical protein n=1 Tax=Neobacillus drentensis TaxID=220684 RepID=UPI002FFEAC53
QSTECFTLKNFYQPIKIIWSQGKGKEKSYIYIGENTLRQFDPPFGWFYLLAVKYTMFRK